LGQEVQMISNSLFNNVGIEALSIAFVLNHQIELQTAKALLIPPIAAHGALLSHLARASTKILSFEKYLIEHLSNFSNFNDRYYDSLTTTMNAIQLLNELEMVEIKGSIMKKVRKIDFENSMGKRAEKVFKAAPNISKLLSDSSDKLYLNLRIEL
jgi:hypothetical protein